MGDDTRYTPFQGRPAAAPTMNVLHRFTKPDGHVAEISERRVTPFRALEFFVFVDGALVESQLFHGSRGLDYGDELEVRIRQFADGGWEPTNS